MEQEKVLQSMNGIYAGLVCYFFDASDRRRIEETSNKYRRNDEEIPEVLKVRINNFWLILIGRGLS